MSDSGRQIGDEREQQYVERHEPLSKSLLKRQAIQRGEEIPTGYVTIKKHQDALDAKDEHIATLRREVDAATDLANKWEWRWKDDQGVWLATRDANQRLAEDNNRLKQALLSAAFPLESVDKEPKE